ncbi:hypothetical protein COL26b_007455 [Colletotrichum chrysophilum]|uniref:uncharacterized protein n=1 Tax=Colletotrichum chrysophilum TaxID=1836956 RepID=UPI0023002246|nr:uncharacterized protein COL26b_007455 [Colletotrichum chrysophilum]KAJ0374375.1 hypothetical protein COL26b_007455 [Colletotrichum chrysophilum]
MSHDPDKPQQPVAKMCTHWKAKREDCGHTVYRWEVRCQEARIKKKACKAWTYRTEWEMGLCNECLTENRYVWKSSYA